MEDKKHVSIFSKIIIYLAFVIIIYTIMTLVYDFSNNNYLEIDNLVKVEDEKEYYIKYMKNKYNLEIVYGDEYANLANIHDGLIESDEGNVLSFLRVFKEAVDKYPTNFFDGKKVKIVLLNKFYNNNIALATRNKLDEYKIFISFNDKLERTFHHEVFHVFEYIYDVNSEFYNFSELNHESFNYLSTFINLSSDKYYDFFDGLYVYNYEKDYNNIYFVTKYSKYSEKEDRAEIFAEIMTADNNKYPIYLDKNINTPLKLKCNKVIEVLNNKVDKNGICYWNRFSY